jgi:hypothetical protein
MQALVFAIQKGKSNRDIYSAPTTKPKNNIKNKLLKLVWDCSCQNRNINGISWLLKCKIVRQQIFLITLSWKVLEYK